MVKNEKGVTMLILVITIIVLFILMGVSVNTGYSTLKNIRVGRIIANLDLIKIKVEAIYENYQFTGDEDFLISADNKKYNLLEISNQNPMYGVREEIDDYRNIASLNNWYEWDKNILKSQGLDTKILDNGGKIFVNYEMSEIIYTKGATMDNDKFYYTLSGIKDAFENE